MAIDPVCHMEVDEKTALSAEKDGRRYYFCSPGCRGTFLGLKGAGVATLLAQSVRLFSA